MPLVRIAITVYFLIYYIAKIFFFFEVEEGELHLFGKQIGNKRSHLRPFYLFFKESLHECKRSSIAYRKSHMETIPLWHAKFQEGVNLLV